MLKFDDDLRLYTKTVRGSDEWEENMNKRSSSERRNSKIKCQYNLENDEVRSKSRWLIRIVMRDAATHADAWLKEVDIDLKEWIISWLDIDQKLTA